MVFLKLKEELLLAIVVDFFNAYFFLQWYFHFDIRFSLEQLQLSTKMVILYRVTNITQIEVLIGFFRGTITFTENYTTIMSHLRNPDCRKFYEFRGIQNGMSIIFDKYIGKHLIEKTMERNNASNIAFLIKPDLLFYEASGG